MSYALPRGYLSPSAINRYISCPACFEMEYILERPKALGSALFLGGAVHKAVEHMRSAVLDASDVVAYDDALEAAADHFDHEIGEASEVELSNGYDSLGAVKDHALELALFVLPELRRLDGQRGLIAAEVTVASSDELLNGASNTALSNVFPFPFKGRIDAVYGKPDGTPTGLADLKTSSKQAAPDFKTVLQMWMYGQTLGTPCAFVDQIGKTKKTTFRTYTLADANENGVDPMRSLVIDVAEQISAGNFPPRPSVFCDYEHNLPRFTLTIEDVEE